ncbi:hypothetical protein [Hyalangium sp.]|uniref:hypothetical protein n=1 Tax=Hyalangium sp. TaxID=2028555 RepID=UPI002D318E11|nr:hypothetical protein [Hyalangium sp.]HYH99659.1 hypothetical protein [Hyalangium sp.]
MNREWPPIDVHSVHFQFEGSGALPLLDPMTGEKLGARPEWIKGVRNEPVAYKRGSIPSVRLGLMAQYLFVPEQIQIRAEGLPLDENSPAPSSKPIVWIKPQTVKIIKRATYFDVLEKHTADSQSRERKVFWFSQPLPDRIGKYTLRLRWIATWKDEDKDIEVIISETQHTLCTTWELPIYDNRMKGQTYTPLMLWTSEWCAGQNEGKAICDAIIKNLPSTNLRYGVPGWEVRYMFMTGGGMCGGWCQMFQRMAGCQGVVVEGRTFRPKYNKRLPTPPMDIAWVAFACTSPGLNQLQPSWLIRFRADFPVEREAYPPRPEPQPDGFPRLTENRYCFPVDGTDGHSINFLVKDGKTVYLYDPSFMSEAIEIDMPLPDVDTEQEMGQDAAFRRQYLDRLFTWFLMTAHIAGTHVPVDLNKRTYGLSVLTTLIPQLSIEWDA